MQKTMCRSKCCPRRRRGDDATEYAAWDWLALLIVRYGAPDVSAGEPPGEDLHVWPEDAGSYMLWSHLPPTVRVNGASLLYFRPLRLRLTTQPTALRLSLVECQLNGGELYRHVWSLPVM
jgi:hypothetical protein